MLKVLYTLIIYPITQIIELIYIAVDNTFNIHGVSIIGVSIGITFLCLPLYAVAESAQEKERLIQKHLKPGVERIKRAFSGDERYMILNTYYRQNNYHPIMALRSSLSLLIQIPFFIAAYIFLSNPALLQGIPFLFIKDLSAPDALIRIAGVSINALPLLMTALNIAGSAIYTKGFSLKEKLQLYIVALVFLLILYQSPSGLVLYWTFNNLFSLIKNIYYKTKRPLLALYLTVILILLSIDIYFIVSGISPEKSGYLIALSVFIPLLPFIVRYLHKILRQQNAGITRRNKTRNALFLVSIATYALLVGLVIPSNVIVSSPQEFSFIDCYTTPLYFIANSSLQAFGAFFLWPLIIYFLFPRRIQSYLCVTAFVITISALINIFLFKANYGTLSPLLVFDTEGEIKVSMGHIVLNNAFMLVLVVLTFILLYYKRLSLMTTFTSLSLVAVFVLGIINTVHIQREYKKLESVYSPPQKVSISPIFNLSSDRPNVLIIMLDRAISGFIPTIFSEDERLKEAYDGFIYYPNTLSYGFYTLEGVPALYGGYDYTPSKINERTNETLVSKHNEALAVLPRIFSANNFNATITDAPWASYSWISNMSYFNTYPERITTLHTQRIYKEEWYLEHGSTMPYVQSALNKRNFIWYGIMCSLPYILRNAVYNDGDYWAAASVSSRNNMFLNSYSVLDFLPRLTNIYSSSPPQEEDSSKDSDKDAPNSKETAAIDTNKGSFIFIANDTTHDSVKCQAPEYIPVDNVTDDGDTLFSSNEQYHGNAAALHVLSKFLQYLKDNGVYDNTRIILVSDHGRNVRTHTFIKERRLPFMREFCNPLLLVKDFNSHGALKTSYAFMTNADTPALALKDLVPNPINPFTNKPLTLSNKLDGVLLTSTKNWMPSQHGKFTFSIAKGDWYRVKDNIFNEDNWQQVVIKKKKRGARVKKVKK